MLQALCGLPAVSGWEAQAAKEVAALFTPYCDHVETDHHGNVLAFRNSGRKHAETLLLDAHLDQVGFLVTEVLEGGFLRFAAVGGVDPRMLLGNEVTILAEKPLYGVISCQPPHLQKAGEQEKAVPIGEMLIDTGLTDAANRIPVGTPVLFAQPPVKLLGDRYASKCLDDRAGIAVLLSVMKRLKKENKLPVNIAILISTQEETTGLGAYSGTFTIQPRYAVAVDVTHGKTPDGPSEGVFPLGSGAAIGMGPNLHRGMTRLLLQTAKAHEIPYTQEVMEGNTGTNAWTMQIVAWGVATALVSIPLRYMHTPVETLAESDIKAAARLLYYFIREFDGEVCAL